MKDSKYYKFQTFGTIEEANALLTLLEEYNIEFETSDESPTVTTGLEFHDPLSNHFVVKLKQEDFEKVSDLIVENTENQIKEIPTDYYLHEFSTNELKEVILKQDEWSELDFIIAKKILKERGIELSSQDLDEMKEQRLADIRKPEKAHKGWLAFGLISAILGGLFGILIGYYFWDFKKTDPTGHRYFVYNESVRNQGKNIFFIGIISLTFWIIFRLFLA